MATVVEKTSPMNFSRKSIMRAANPITKSDFDAVIFAMDGVATRTADIHAEAWKKMFDNYLMGMAARTDRRYEPFDVATDYTLCRRKAALRRCAGFSRLAGDRASGGGPDREMVCGLGNRKDRYFHEILEKQGAKPYDSTAEFIQKLWKSEKR
jgi:alpha,alpha-trehalase